MHAAQPAQPPLLSTFHFAGPNACRAASPTPAPLLAPIVRFQALSFPRPLHRQPAAPPAPPAPGVGGPGAEADTRAQVEALRHSAAEREAAARQALAQALADAEAHASAAERLRAQVAPLQEQVSLSGQAAEAAEAAEAAMRRSGWG